jgi:hypothetical protein
MMKREKMMVGDIFKLYEAIKKEVYEEKSIEEIEKDIKAVIDIQITDPSNKTDEYMRGLSNGLIMAKSLVDEKDPKFMNKDGSIEKDNKNE